MYERFYGLRERAFNLTPDPAFLFLNKRSKDALDQIMYGIERREGFAVIVGDVGTGKTTLCWALLERLEKRKVRTALIQNPMLSDTDILRSILQDLGVRPQGSNPPAGGESGMEVFDTGWMHGMSKKELIDRLNVFLAERAREDVFTVLIIDESQNLSMEMLEQLRLLSNLETAKKKLLQIIFAGQLELNAKLRTHALRQLNQRISVRFETRLLSEEDTRKYINHRLAMAGGAPKLNFSRGAYKAVWRYSKGCPRLINLICDRALLAGYTERSLAISPKYVHRAVLGLEGKEGISARRFPGWVGRLIPLCVPLALLASGVVVWERKEISPLTVYSSSGSPIPAAAALMSGKPAPVVSLHESPGPGIAAAQNGPAKPAADESGLTPSSTGAPGPDSAAAGRQSARFVLQIHSFRKKQPAEESLAPLERTGDPVLVKFIGSGAGPGWFAVYVGPFDDLATAREKASVLRAGGYSPVIRRISR